MNQKQHYTVGINSWLYTSPEIPALELEEVGNQTKSCFLM